MNDRDRYKRKRQLRQSEIATDTGAIELHNGTETHEHLVVKALLALRLRRAGRPFGTEVQVGDRGRVDVLDWGPPDGKAVAYEVETECTPERKRQKVEQYTSWIVRDVIVLPVQEAPERLPELWQWVGSFVLG